VPTVTVQNLDLLPMQRSREPGGCLPASRHQGDGRYYFAAVTFVTAIGSTAASGEAVRPSGGVAGRRSTAGAIVHLAPSPPSIGPSRSRDICRYQRRGTLELLECTRVALDDTRPFRFLHVSTDEVSELSVQTTPHRRHSARPEESILRDKAGADLLVRAYRETFDLAVLITRCSITMGRTSLRSSSP